MYDIESHRFNIERSIVLKKKKKKIVRKNLQCFFVEQTCQTLKL